ncbi:hypothetical protein H9Q73_003846 [Fusarium xylarioides]|nr:hypothetical protein H9Q73_003846 [Fusarium xylarioides]
MFKANLRSQIGKTYVKFSGGGGADPPVTAYVDHNEKTDESQIWRFYSVPGYDTRVVIKNQGMRGPLFAETYASFAEDEYAVQCKKNASVWNATSQWYLEGGDIEDMKSGLRNVKLSHSYLDLSSGSKANGTAFLVYPGHWGTNQAFKLENLSREQ